MAMIASLRVNNATTANLGNVAIQPVTTTPGAQANKQLTTPVTAISSHPLPAYQAPVGLPIIIVKGAITLKNDLSVSVADVVKQMTAPRMVIPLTNGVNTIMPTFNLALNAGKQNDPRLTLGFIETATNFQPYEQLTGISQERPEVVMLSHFLPLFDHDAVGASPNFIGLIEAGGINSYMTDAGKYLDAQINIRNLRSFNTQSLITQLKARYANIAKQFNDREAAFSSALSALNVDASFLLNLVRIIESQKAQLDLRHDIYLIDPTQVGSLNSTNFAQQQVSTNAQVGGSRAPTSNFAKFAQLLKPKYDFVDVLVELGYKQDTVAKVYASSKIWMQVLVELSYALKYHTLQFLDIDPSSQRNDTNPSTILLPQANRFSLALSLPNLANLDELSNLQVAQAQDTLGTIRPAYNLIYQNVLFKDEEARIAALAHLLTSEYRYSQGLTNDSTRRILRDFYGFTVSDQGGNSSLFDSIIGKFGNNITDFPSQATNVLTSIAQQISGDTGVLTFETKYVEGDTGTTTPGGDYYFDQILQTDGTKFNTTNIDALALVLERSHDAFSIVVDGLKLMADYGRDGVILNNTSALLDAIKTKLVDASGTTSQMLQNDKLAAVFAYARNDNNVKSTLFLYIISKISRSYGINVPGFASSPTADNTPLVDYLVELVNQSLAASVPTSRTTIQFINDEGLNNVVTTALTPEAIATALKSGTELTTYIQQLMSQILIQFRVTTTAINKGYTRFNGYIDTTVLMVAFDLIIAMVARYGNTSIVGTTSDQTTITAGLTNYTIARSGTGNADSIRELSERADGEDARVQQMILAIIGGMKALNASLKLISNYLKSPPAIQHLQDIATILNHDQQLLGMLFSEQQIMMLAASVQNLLAASAPTQPTSKAKASQGISGTPKKVQVLDESQISPALRAALFGYFGTDQFATVKGTNKRILTVGVPLGFTQRLKQKVNIQQQQRASFQNRRNDIVNVCVYKIDLVNSDIIYKPQRFMFEMSRFPARLTTAQWLPLPQQPTAADVINSIPTLNFSQDPNAGTAAAITNGFEYASSVIAGNDGLKNVRVALDDDSYSFLTANQKAELLQNHVASQLLESYIKLMIGMDVAESNFSMAPAAPPAEASFVQTLTEHMVSSVADQVTRKATQPPGKGSTAPSGGVMFSTTVVGSPPGIQSLAAPASISQPTYANAAGVGGSVTTSTVNGQIQPASAPIQSLEQQAVVGNLDANLSTISARNTSVVYEQLRTINGFSNTLTTASDPTSLAQRVVAPRTFDRVFNIIVDPNDFEIDVTATIASPYGKDALGLMIANGEIVTATESDQAAFQVLATAVRATTPGSRSFGRGRPAPNVNNYQYRPRDRNNGDLITDKYFVTIETLDEGT